MENGIKERRGPWWLPFLSSPVAVVGFAAAHYLNVLGPAPLWVLLAMVGATAVSSGTVEFSARRMTNAKVRRHLRLASAVIATTVIIYTTSWGPVIGIGYVLAVIDALRTEGGHSWLPGTLWSLAGLTAGQIAIALGIAPSVLTPHDAHVIAAADAACIAIVLYSLGRAATAAEIAEAEIVTEREHFRALVQHASDVIVTVRAETLEIEYISPAVEALLGYSPEECVGRPISSLIAGATSESMPGFVERLASIGGSETSEITLEHRSGSPRIVEVTSTLREDGVVIGNMHDVTEQRALERQLRHQANHDVLTGLMNRAALVESLEELAAGSLVPERVSVLFVDLDGFKDVNDALGHEQGDAVLVEAASRITSSVPLHAMTGRLGGDEFLVVLPSTTNREASLIAANIIDGLQQPWPLADHCISASIGVATTTVPESVEDILRRADEAMYEAKRQGRGRYALARAA